MQMSEQTITKVAIIGLGKMGRNHYGCLQELSNVEIVGVVEPRGFSEFHGPVYDTVSALLSDTKPDAAIIATPTASHWAPAAELLTAGVHILLEKPVCATSKEAQLLKALATKNSCKVAVGHIERFNPAIICAMADMKQHQEDILHCDICRVSPYPSRIDDVGVALDLSIHDVDLLRFLTGQEIITQAVNCMKVKGNHEDLIHWFLKFENGSSASILNSWLAPACERVVKIFTHGSSYTINLMSQTVTKTSSAPGGHPQRAILAVPLANALVEELKAFVHYCKSDQPGNLALLEDGTQALQLVEGPWD
jgi:predicted dehydrogenase